MWTLWHVSVQATARISHRKRTWRSVFRGVAYVAAGGVVYVAAGGVAYVAAGGVAYVAAVLFFVFYKDIVCQKLRFQHLP